jgi:hypothetical protein
LHNLRVPFAGSILTSVGVVLLISVSYIWKEKGIFWRAGLICALMKTMSPSAVIFGPMIAIFTESLLLEFAVRLFGRTYLGFIVGAVSAVGWGFAQKIINLLIFYGFNIVELYKSLMKYTEKQLNMQTDTLWIPILALFSIYVLIGLISAFTGIKTGKKMASQPLVYKPPKPKYQAYLDNNRAKHEYNYSLTWLVINIFLLIGSILTLSLSSFKIWGIVTVVVVTVWILKYKRALRQLLKPKFWIFFVA